MRKVFDLMAVFNGIIGMGGLIINLGELTSETATLFCARALMVIAFVVVPYFVARAIEKSGLTVSAPRMMAARPRQPQPASQTTYFDYLFQPGSAFDWRSNRIATMQSRRNTNNAPDVEM